MWMSHALWRILLLAVILLLPELSRAQQQRCNVHGCWQPGGGCNIHGCWANGGGCNIHGCWNSPMGACNIHGCSDWGQCNLHGCPPPPPRRRQRVPNEQVPPPVVAPQRAPSDYAQEGDEVPSVVRRFNQGGVRFDYPAQFTVSMDRLKNEQLIITLDGPGWLDGHIYVSRSDSRDPEVVRRNVVQGLGAEFVERGLRALGSKAISADFADGRHGGVRDRYDNRSDVIVQDSYAWRRQDGSLIIVMFSYESSAAASAGQMYPVIARSLR